MDGHFPLPLSPVVLECDHPLRVSLAYLQHNNPTNEWVWVSFGHTHPSTPITWCEGLDTGCCCLYVCINGGRLGSYFHLQNTNDPFTVTKLRSGRGGREGGRERRGKRGRVEGGREEGKMEGGKKMREGKRAHKDRYTSFSSLSVLCLV